jgi:hypothetical protein
MDSNDLMAKPFLGWQMRTITLAKLYDTEALVTSFISLAFVSWFIHFFGYYESYGITFSRIMAIDPSGFVVILICTLSLGFMAAYLFHRGQNLTMKALTHINPQARLRRSTAVMRATTFLFLSGLSGWFFVSDILICIAFCLVTGIYVGLYFSYVGKKNAAFKSGHIQVT